MNKNDRELLYIKSYIRVTTFEGIKGDLDTLYYLTVPYDVYAPGLYMWEENIGFSVVITEGGSGTLFVGIVTHITTAFPTTRPDGTALKLGDYVKPDSSETFPFTVDGKTFTTAKDTGVYMGADWIINANPYQNTSETSVKDNTIESLSKTANYQSQINSENAAAIKKRIEQCGTMPACTLSDVDRIVQYVGVSGALYKNGYFYKGIFDTSVTPNVYKWERIDVQPAGLPFVHEQTTPSSAWSVMHNFGRYPSAVNIIDGVGNQILAEIDFPNGNEVIIRFAENTTGKAFVF